MTAASGPESSGAEPHAVRAAVARATAVDPDAVQVRETHISVLFITAERAYKLKKPLVLDFLDYGTAARRRQMCAEEVRLNARLAPETYLGVRSLVPSEGGLRLADDDDPGAIDYVVEMRRYDEDQTLAAAVGRDAAGPREAEAVGRRLAHFHRDCPAAPATSGAAAVLAGMQRNLRELIGQLDAPADRDHSFSLGRFLEAFVCARRRARSACGPRASTRLPRRSTSRACDPAPPAERRRLR